ncbi:ribonuclease H-like domain-containing protein [Tanacetum coccineum]
MALGPGNPNRESKMIRPGLRLYRDRAPLQTCASSVRKEKKKNGFVDILHTLLSNHEKRLVDLNPTTAKGSHGHILRLFSRQQSPGNDDVVTFALEGLPSTYETISTVIVSREPFPDLKTCRRGPSLEKVNNPCWSFAKGSCRFGDACKYLHNGVHGKSTLLPRTSGSASSVSGVTRSDLDMLQSLLAKFGLNAPNIHPLSLFAIRFLSPPGFPRSFAINCAAHYLSLTVMAGFFWVSNMNAVFPKWVQVSKNQNGSPIRGFHLAPQGVHLVPGTSQRSVQFTTAGKNMTASFVSRLVLVTSDLDIVHSDLWTISFRDFLVPDYVVSRSYSHTFHTPLVDVPTPPTPPTPPSLPASQYVPPKFVPEHAPVPTIIHQRSIQPMVTRSRVGTTRPNPSLRLFDVKKLFSPFDKPALFGLFLSLAVPLQDPHNFTRTDITNCCAPFSLHMHDPHKALISSAPQVGFLRMIQGLETMVYNYFHLLLTLFDCLFDADWEVFALTTRRAKAEYLWCCQCWFAEPVGSGLLSMSFILLYLPPLLYIVIILLHGQVRVLHVPSIQYAITSLRCLPSALF